MTPEKALHVFRQAFGEPGASFLSPCEARFFETLEVSCGDSGSLRFVRCNVSLNELDAFYYADELDGLLSDLAPIVRGPVIQHQADPELGLAEGSVYIYSEGGRNLVVLEPAHDGSEAYISAMVYLAVDDTSPCPESLRQAALSIYSSLAAAHFRAVYAVLSQFVTQVGVALPDAPIAAALSGQPLPPARYEHLWRDSWTRAC